MFHRLLVIASEDIFVANPTLPEHLDKLVNIWNDSREKVLKTKKNIYQELDLQRITLLKMIKMLCESPKSRLFSYVRAVWYNKLNREYITKYFPDIYKNVPEFDEKKIVNKYLLDENEKYIKNMKKLCFYVEQKHDKAYKYVMYFSYLDKTHKLKHKILKRSKPVYAVWDYIFKAGSKIIPYYKKIEPSIKALYSWFNEAPSENSLYVAQALTYFIRRDDLEELILPFSKDIEITNEEKMELYSKNLQNNKLVLDDYVIDMHTKKGRGMKSGKFYFMFAGSLVNNEVMSLISDEYRIIYSSISKYYKADKLTLRGKKGKEIIELKTPIKIEEIYKLIKKGLSEDFKREDLDEPQREDLHQDFQKGEKSKIKKKIIEYSSSSEDENIEEKLFIEKDEYEESNFKDIVRAQLLTAKYRPDVYFAKYINYDEKFPYKNVVVKGPYLKEDELESVIYIANEKKKYKGINEIPYKVVDLYPMSSDKMENPENFGSRTKIEKNKKYKFLIMKNVCSDEDTYQDLPYKLKSSSLWKETKVIDSEKIGIINGSILLIPKKYHLDLILTLIFRWIYQVYDSCERNIIFCNEKVYGLDEEKYKTEHSLKNLYNKPLGDGEVGSKKKKLFKEAIEKNWDIIEKYLFEWKKIKKPTWVDKNLEKIDKEYLIDLL